MPYTVSIYVAAPGTEVLGAKRGDPSSTSTAGHAWYQISDGKQKSDYGFAPKEHGQFSGPGVVSHGDTGKYVNPYYVRTIEVSKEQYERLKEYGEAGMKGTGKFFDTNYNAADNSCVDFTWKGLNHAGLHFQEPGRNGMRANPLYEGSNKPINNVHDFDTIPAPFPHSQLNSRQTHPMPEKRSFLQHLLSENDALSPEKQKFATQTAQAVEALQRREPKLAALQPGQIDNLSASLAHSGWKNGMAKADGAVLNAADPGKATLIGRDGGQKIQHASVEVDSATRQPAAASLASLAAAPDKSSSAPAQAIRTASRSAGGMSLG
ncbi:XVIPCD domain-containing protein [Chromobacterium subtsugae]|uniref:XVIPCD domain-containing protein n=1 Tax=Chromobacterium subtsugae TaxID=251747 RepID=UPI00128C79C3|nr:XVIPCD domain-containing protein [Chromobacterium subtsugae]